LQEITAISAPFLPRERELSLALVQTSNFLIMEQCFGHLTVEFIPGNTAFSAPLFPREREFILAHAQIWSFLILEQSCSPLAVEIVPGKHCDFSTYIEKRTTAQSGACAEVQFPNYGTELWSPGTRICSRIALRFQHLSCQESES
jgi:hypothetical protein